MASPNAAGTSATASFTLTQSDADAANAKFCLLVPSTNYDGQYDSWYRAGTTTVLFYKGCLGYYYYCTSSTDIWNWVASTTTVLS